MADENSLNGVVYGKILQLVTMPFSVTQDAVWQQSVDAAYRALSHLPAFHKVLEHWTVTVLLNQEADPGARNLIIEIIRSMNAINQVGTPRWEERP